MSNLEKLKLRLGINSSKEDSLLELILEDSKAEIIDYCRLEEFNNILEPVQRELAIIYYNRQGTEGEVSRSEGGISSSYGTDIPQNLKDRLKRYRKVKVIKY